MKLPAQRTVNKIGFWLCIGLIGSALYLQTQMALTPCPLCILQRVMVFLLALNFLFGWLKLFTGTGRNMHGFLTLLFAGMGAGLALRQIWLEKLPVGQAPPCGPSLSYMLENLPFHETLMAIFQGSAECAQINWRLLDLTIPHWTLIFFAIFAVLGIWQMMRADER